MSILDFSKNCNIFTSSFVDDLEPYSLKDGKILWLYNTDKDIIPSYTIKDNEDFFSDANAENYWAPNFITHDGKIKNKIISHYGSILGDSSLSSGRIGIEDFITFEPKFKNWSTSNNQMVIDWILNRSRVPYCIVGGLSYWKIKSSPTTGKIESFPLYSKIKYDNIEYIKLDNNTLRKLTVQNNVFQNNYTNNNSSNIIFNYTDDDANTPVSSLGNNIVFTLVGSDKSRLWIADGDQLLYFLNQGERDKNLIDNIGPRSYVSGSLYKYYNLFYNSLTAGEKSVGLDEKRSVKKLRLYKKLAHALSTSPFCSEFFISLLSKPSSDIKDAIRKYLQSDFRSNRGSIAALSDDIENLKIVLSIISKEYSKYEIVDSNNLIHNNDELFLKLINKYGAKLKLTGHTTVTYTKPLKYGDNVLIEEIGETLVEKTLQGTIIVNNKKIMTNKLTIETKLDKNSSLIELKLQSVDKDNKFTETVANTIPLYNSVKPELKDGSAINILLEKNTNGSDNTIVGQDLITNVFFWSINGKIEDMQENWIKYCPRLSVLQMNLDVKYLDPKLPNQAYDLVSNDFFCSWEKVSGPPLKFVDLGKTQTNKKYNRAYGPEVVIVPSSTGRYVIKCTISSPFGSYTKIKTIFIVDGRKTMPSPNGGMVNNPYFNSYSDGIVLDDLFNLYFKTEKDGTFSKNRIFADLNQIKNIHNLENAPIIINRDKLKVFISGFDAFALHRKGLYAPIRTNYYVEKVTRNSRLIEKLNENYKFSYYGDIVQNSLKQNSNLDIVYICGNTTIKLDRIILQNIRNETEECSQCYSLYKPKFKSETSIGGDRPVFQRTNKFPDDFVLQKYIFVDEKSFNQFNRESLKGYEYPKISTDLAPPIKTYGGYGNKVLGSIPLDIKNDPLNIGVPEKIDDNAGNIANSAKLLSSADGYKLDYKDDYDKLDNKFREYKLCYQQHVMPSGYIEFSKGTFVPSSGWVMGDNRNLSSVLKFNPGARKTFNFAGPGIIGLSNYTNTNEISANIFSSSIELNINPLIRWENGGLLCTPGKSEEQIRNERAEINGKYNIKNQINKELSDQYYGTSNQYHHGYRILNGGQPKSAETNLVHNSVPQNDEFNISIDETLIIFIYSFKVVGPNNPISLDNEAKEFIDLYINQNIGPGTGGDGLKVRNYIENKNLGLRNPKINNLKIKDIEVQLNFLNYVNTKNLVIWLEVEHGGSSKKSIISTDGKSAPKQIIADNLFVDQFISNDTYKAFSQPKDIINNFTITDDISINNSNIKSYIKTLTDNNSRENIGDNLIIYLLNQEIIQNKDYNFSIRFSDTANKHNVLFDQNMLSSGCLDPDQIVIQNKDSVNPTRNTIDFDTYTSSTNSNLIKFHNLNINNNTFNKFRDRSLFLADNPDAAENCSYKG